MSEEVCRVTHPKADVWCSLPVKHKGAHCSRKWGMWWKPRPNEVQAAPHVEPDDRLTVREAATAAGVHPATIRRAIVAGDLQAERVGQKLLRIRPSELASWQARPVVVSGSLTSEVQK